MVDRLRYEVAQYLGVGLVMRRYHRSHALILCYHGVVRTPAQMPRWTDVTVSEFRSQMVYTKKRYRVLRLREIIEHMQNGDTLPPHTAAITFDDGYENNFTNAFPVLHELGLTATIFVTTGFLDGEGLLWPDRLSLLLAETSTARIHFAGQSLPLVTSSERERARALSAQHLKSLPRGEKDRQLEALERQLGPPSGCPGELIPLSWDQVRAMQASDLIDFGSHTVSHQIVSRLQISEKQDEIVRSCERIEAETSRPCCLFAYPNGEAADFDAESQQLLRRTGVLAAVTAIPGLVGPDPDFWALPRVLVGADAGAAKFALLSSGAIALLHRTRGKHGGTYHGAA